MAATPRARCGRLPRVSTFVSIMVYATAVLVGLVALSGAFLLAAGWVVRHTDEPDAGH